ncbi:MAG: hypothetical protein KIH64_007720 [Mycobacterium sp.]|nr:hypothetical protein [Mycobacterium sp.]
MPEHSSLLGRRTAIAGFALLSAVIPLASLAAPSGSTANNADCAVGFYWDTVNMICAPVVDPVLGPVGPVGVGGVVGPVGVDPVLGPVGPVGVGGVGPVAGPVGPVGVGGVVGPVGVDPVLGPVGPVGVGRR